MRVLLCRGLLLAIGTGAFFARGAPAGETAVSGEGEATAGDGSASASGGGEPVRLDTCPQLPARSV